MHQKIKDIHLTHVVNYPLEVNHVYQTLHLRLRQEREQIPDVPAVYFVSPTPENVKAISGDFANSLYDAYHLNFASALPASALEELATSAVPLTTSGRPERSAAAGSCTEIVSGAWTS